MVDRSMKGLYPILAMPFDSRDRIDVEDLQREVEFSIEAGVDGLGLAFGSEINRMSEAERDLVAKTVVEQSAGRVNVVVNTGAQATEVVVQYSRRAEELGADAVMATPPWPAPGEDMVREYFSRIAEAVTVPIFMQDVSGAEVPPALAARIASETGSACYAKIEVLPTPTRIAQAIQASDGALIVFGGAGGSFLLEEMRRGSVGTMPHCAVPDVFRRVMDLFNGGQHDEAEQEFNRHTPYFRLLESGSSASLQYAVKEILRLRGVFKTARVRHPTDPPEDFIRRETAEVVERLGLSSYRA